MIQPQFSHWWLNILTDWNFERMKEVIIDQSLMLTIHDDFLYGIYSKFSSSSKQRSIFQVWTKLNLKSTSLGHFEGGLCSYYQSYLNFGLKTGNPILNWKYVIITKMWLFELYWLLLNSWVTYWLAGLKNLNIIQLYESSQTLLEGNILYQSVVQL